MQSNDPMFGFSQMGQLGLPSATAPFGTSGLLLNPLPTSLDLQESSASPFQPASLGLGLDFGMSNLLRHSSSLSGSDGTASGPGTPHAGHAGHAGLPALLPLPLPSLTTHDFALPTTLPPAMAAPAAQDGPQLALLEAQLQQLEREKAAAARKRELLEQLARAQAEVAEMEATNMSLQQQIVAPPPPALSIAVSAASSVLEPSPTASPDGADGDYGGGAWPSSPSAPAAAPAPPDDPAALEQRKFQASLIAALKAAGGKMTLASLAVILPHGNRFEKKVDQVPGVKVIWEGKTKWAHLVPTNIDTGITRTMPQGFHDAVLSLLHLHGGSVKLSTLGNQLPLEYRVANLPEHVGRVAGVRIVFDGESRHAVLEGHAPPKEAVPARPSPAVLAAIADAALAPAVADEEFCAAVVEVMQRAGKPLLTAMLGNMLPIHLRGKGSLVERLKQVSGLVLFSDDKKRTCVAMEGWHFDGIPMATGGDGNSSGGGGGGGASPNPYGPDNSFNPVERLHKTARAVVRTAGGRMPLDKLATALSMEVWMPLSEDGSGDVPLPRRLEMLGTVPLLNIETAADGAKFISAIDPKAGPEFRNKVIAIMSSLHAPISMISLGHLLPPELRGHSANGSSLAQRLAAVPGVKLEKTPQGVFAYLEPGAAEAHAREAGSSTESTAASGSGEGSAGGRTLLGNGNTREWRGGNSGGAFDSFHHTHGGASRGGQGYGHGHGHGGAFGARRGGGMGSGGSGYSGSNSDRRHGDSGSGTGSGSGGSSSGSPGVFRRGAPWSATHGHGHNHASMPPSSTSATSSASSASPRGAVAAAAPVAPVGAAAAVNGMPGTVRLLSSRLVTAPTSSGSGGSPGSSGPSASPNAKFGGARLAAGPPGLPGAKALASSSSSSSVDLPAPTLLPIS